MRKWIIGALVAIALAGCSTTGTQDAAPVEERAPADAAAATPGTAPGATPGATTSGATTSPVTGTPGGTTAATPTMHKDPKSILARRSVYFDYDEFVIKDEYKAIVEAHAKYLQANRGLRLIVQGNTDERGTREYNIALGQKRADAVKRAMMVLGAPETQIETVSFGKERPRREGHDEASWAENRRGDIVYAGE
jgi:peptidoglycan-associated lipoprotein